MVFEMAYTNEQLAKLRCAYCDKPFGTYPKPGQYNLPDEIPYVDGGIVTMDEEDGTKKHYHGYVGNNHQCFEKAMKEENLDKKSPDLKDTDNWDLV